MKRKNEVISALKKHGLLNENAEINVFTDSNPARRLEYFLSFGELRLFERPDCYIKNGEEMLVIEHFEVDGFLSSKKESDFRIKEAERETIVDEAKRQADNYIVSTEIGVRNTYEQLLANVITLFEHHYDRIDDYKYQLKDCEVATNLTSFTI